VRYIQNPNIIIRIERDAAIIFDKKLRQHYIISHEQFRILQLFKIPKSITEVIDIEVKYASEKATIIGCLSDLRMKNMIIEAVDNSSKYPSTQILDYSKVSNASFPLYVSLYISNKCNHSCEYCYVMSQDTENCNVYSDSQIVDTLLKELTDKGCFYISLIGGEPFMEPKILSTFLKKISLQKVYLVTNCSIKKSFSDIFIQYIAQKGNVIVRTSLTHLDPEIHDKVVSYPGSFSSVTKVLANLAQNHVETETVIVATSQNMKVINEMISFLETLGVNRIFVEFPMPFYGQNLDDYIHLLPETNEFIDLIEKYDKSKRVSVNDKYIFPYNSKTDCQTVHFYSASRCHAAKYSASIMTDGSCYPCCSAIGNPRFIMGNILSTTLESIWSGYNTSFFHGRDVSKLNMKCRKCSMKERCIGGCPICADIFYKDSYAGDVRCKIDNHEK